MSVINRMLQDLEARRAGNGQAPTAVRATPPDPVNRRLLLWCVLGAAAIGVAAFGDWPQWASAQAARMPQVAAIAPEPVALPSPTPSMTPLPMTPIQTPAHETAPQPPKPLPMQAIARDVVQPAAKRSDADGALRPATPASARTTPARAQSGPAPAPAARKAAPPLTMAAVSYGLEPTLGTASSETLKPPAALAPPRAMPDSAAPPAAPSPGGRVDKRMSPQSPQQMAQALTRQGQQAAASGHGRTALEFFEQALALQPGLLAARVPAVALLLEQGRNADAQALARAGLSLAPGDAQLSYLLARDLAGAGERSAALAVLDSASQRDAEALGLRAGLLTQQGEYKRAGEDYEAALRTQPANSLWWLGLGVALESQGQPQQARRVYARAQNLGLDSHELSLFVDRKLAALQ